MCSCLRRMQDQSPFENWAVIALGGIPNKVQVGDMGVDGRIFPVGTKPAEGGLFSDDWFPIQVKQMDKVGRPDIDAFEAVMEREGEGGRQRGFFVSFGYTKDAEQECAAFHKRTGRIIKLLTVQEIWMRRMCRRCDGQRFSDGLFA